MQPGEPVFVVTLFPLPMFLDYVGCVCVVFFVCLFLFLVLLNLQLYKAIVTHFRAINCMKIMSNLIILRVQPT